MDKGNLCAILANRFFCGQLSLFFFALFGMAGGRVVRAESERAVEPCGCATADQLFIILSTTTSLP